jgi:hypothetical protein
MLLVKQRNKGAPSMSYRQMGLLLPCLLFATQLAAQATPSINWTPYPPSVGDLTAYGPILPNDSPLAQRHLSRAVDDLQKADALERSSGADPARIQKLYWNARDQLDAARANTHGDPAMLAEVFNSIAYAETRLDHPQAGLDAADRALRLAPTLTRALENRGEALVALRRTEEAKQVYLTLVPQHRRLASVLLAYMQQWIDTQRKTTETPQGLLDAFQEWVGMQAQIAASPAAGA